MAQNSTVPRSQQDYITQVSEEIEGRVVKKLSQEFNRMENGILGALSRLDNFLMNPLLQGCSGTSPEMARNAYGTNHGTSDDDSQSEHHPEAGLLRSQKTGNFGPEDGHDVVTGANEEVNYCSPKTASGKQKKNSSTSFHFCSEKIPPTIEADQIFLAFQQLASNNKYANFHRNINRISPLPKMLITTMPTFDGNSEKLELFEDLHQTSLKIHNQLTSDDRINNFHFLMMGDALETLNNNIGRARENLREFQAFFLEKYVKPQPMATAEHKVQKIVFHPANQS